MKKVILVTILSLSMFQFGCSALKCGCGEPAPAVKSAEVAAPAAADKKGCGCEGCKHAAGAESCSMKK